MPEKAVIFDMMGVIIKQTHTIRDVLVPMLGVEYKTAENAYRDYAVSAISQEEFWQSLGIKDYPQTEKKYLDKHELNDSVSDVLDYLKPKYKLILFGGFPTEWFNYLITKYDLKDKFDVLECTGMTRLGKKDSKAFEHIIKITSADAANTYHIDDRPKYISSSAPLGIKTIWYDNGLWPEEKFVNCAPDFTIHSLLDLKKIL